MAYLWAYPGFFSLLLLWHGQDTIPGITNIGVLTRFVLALAEVILVLGTPGEIMTRSKGADRSARHSSAFTAYRSDGTRWFE